MAAAVRQKQRVLHAVAPRDREGSGGTRWRQPDDGAEVEEM